MSLGFGVILAKDSLLKTFYLFGPGSKSPKYYPTVTHYTKVRKLTPNKTYIERI